MQHLPHTTLAGILLRDRFGGRVGIDRHGAPIVDYHLSRYDAAHLRRGIAAGAELLEAAGAPQLWLPVPRAINHPPRPAPARARCRPRLAPARVGARART